MRQTLSHFFTSSSSLCESIAVTGVEWTVFIRRRRGSMVWQEVYLKTSRVFDFSGESENNFWVIYSGSEELVFLSSDTEDLTFFWFGNFHGQESRTPSFFFLLDPLCGRYPFK